MRAWDATCLRKKSSHWLPLICRFTKIMDNKLQAMTLESSRLGESLNVAEGQWQGLRPTSKSFESTSKPDQSMTGKSKYCGTQHRCGRNQCPAFGKSCCSCGIANHFTKVCMKRGQNTHQLNAMDSGGPRCRWLQLEPELDQSAPRNIPVALKVAVKRSWTNMRRTDT